MLMLGRRAQAFSTPGTLIQCSNLHVVSGQTVLGKLILISCQSPNSGWPGLPLVRFSKAVRRPGWEQPIWPTGPEISPTRYPAAEPRRCR